jgi:hypothetical protein
MDALLIVATALQAVGSLVAITALLTHGRAVS